MGSACTCCRENAIVAIPTNYMTPVAEPRISLPIRVERPRPEPLSLDCILSPVNSNYPPQNPDSICKCMRGDEITCPAEIHCCRCRFLRSAPVCLSYDHFCLCKTQDPSIICRRHMIRVVYDTEHACSVCLSPVASREVAQKTLVRLKVCGHYYHCDCIKTWLARGRHVCPVCSRPISSHPADSITPEWIGIEDGDWR